MAKVAAVWHTVSMGFREQVAEQLTNARRTGMHMHRDTRQGFTLIELLTVIAIIVILAALLFPAVGKVRQKAKIMKARQEISQIDVALRGYADEYNRPVPNVVGYGNWAESTLQGIQITDPMVRMLAGDTTVLDGDGNVANPRGVAFLEIPQNSLRNGAFADPWYESEPPWDQNFYKFMMDYNDDGAVEVHFENMMGTTSLVNQAIAVWSRGADAKDEEGFQEDDVRNW